MNVGLVETLTFDDGSSPVVQESSRSVGMVFTSRTTTVELVDHLPAELVDVPAT